MTDSASTIAAAAADILAARPVYLDTETTGLGTDDVIVEIAIVDADGATLLESLVHTAKQMDDVVVGIHGITNEALRGAPTWPEIAPRVAALIAGRTVVGHRVSFDAALLEQTAKAAGLEPPCPARYVCSMELVRPEFPGLDHISLKRSMEHFGVTPAGIPGKAHRAAFDAKCCRALVGAVAVSAQLQAA